MTRPGLAWTGRLLKTADLICRQCEPLAFLLSGLLFVTVSCGYAADADTNNWRSLFDGKTLAGWKITDFGGQGEVVVEEGQLVLRSGALLTGVNWTNAIPRIDYEISIEAKKVNGSDFFCGLTFPVGDTFCTLIVGGWGGGVVGLSNVDDMDASENETTQYQSFEQGRWYHIRLRVSKERIEVWIDNERFVNQPITGRQISLRPGDIELSKPLGLATWQTTGAFRSIRIRELSAMKPAN